MELFTYIKIFLSCVIGATIDARMWGDKKADKPFLKRYTDIYWLASWNLIMPLLWMSTNISIPLFLLISFGMSAFWDMVFFKWESDVWITTIRRWTALPWFGPNKVYSRFLSVEDGLLVLGFNTKNDMTIFIVLRLVILIGSMFI